MMDFTTRPVRSSLILTTSYVAGTIIDTTAQAMKFNQLILNCDFTKGSLTSLEIKLEYSNDGTTYRQLATQGVSGGTITLTPVEYSMVCSSLGATQSFVLEVPIKYRYIKASFKGTGTVTSSLLAVDAILGEV